MASKDLQRIRDAVLLGRVKLTHHALEEIDEDDLDVLDVESALLTGRIVQKQKHSIPVKYKVCGKSTFDDMITVIGRFTESNYFLIITVFSGE